MMQVRIVNVPRKPGDVQVYMQSFCQAYINCGGLAVERKPWYRYRLVRHGLKLMALSGLRFRTEKKAYIVCSRGGHLLKSALPYLFWGEIIPMLWDCWPNTWDKLEKSLRQMKCRLCFMTASDAAKEMSKRLPHIKFVHVPEGLDVNDYLPGKPLAERSTDLYELGQKHNYYHKLLIDDQLNRRISMIYNERPIKNIHMVYRSFETFTRKLADTRIIVSFPNCMRNPNDNGMVATLTMRYWEAMLSRCIIVGHGPKELIQLIGYNPVIEADFIHPSKQIEQLLSQVEHYQPMVDKNRETALRYAPWSERIPLIFQELKALE